jgi:nitroimidazol reductase NimA-like FMN-containing flavoprotein (pyridoxamine 5'-phosphate oxidase superfamily)
MAPKTEIRQALQELLASQRLAALSTHSGGQPYASLVAFASSDDLREIYFATPRGTRKYAHLAADGRVALLIHSSSNLESDFKEAAAVTVIGSAAEALGEDRCKAMAVYLAKHPYLADFVRSDSSALVRVQVRSYILVENFQRVTEMPIDP